MREEEASSSQANRREEQREGQGPGRRGGREEGRKVMQTRRGNDYRIQAKLVYYNERIV